MNRFRGFTLIELMVALLVGALIMTLAVPAFRSVIERNRLAGAVNQWVGAIGFARNAAVTRATQVTVCPSTDGSSCSAGAAWASGWIAFTDGGTAGTVDGSDRVLRVGDATPGVQFTVASGFTNGYVAISAQGFAPAGGGVLHVCPTDSSRSGTKVTLGATGNVSSDAYTCP